MATYEISITSPSSIVAGDILKCSYTGAEVSITLPAGVYSIDCYGGEGGVGGRYQNYSSYAIAGLGGHSTGTLALSSQTTLYLNVGGKGENYYGTATDVRPGGYNGGGSNGSYGGVGGGATHIATRSGLLSSLENNKSSIIIVAGGGGGASAYNNSYYGSGGAGGGLNGGSGTDQGSASLATCGQGGTQTEGGAKGTFTNGNAEGLAGSFGQGGNATVFSADYATSAGGGGYYGGGSGSGDEGGGGGGSGYLRSDLTNATTEASSHSGHGEITITVVSVSQTASNTFYIKSDSTWSSVSVVKGYKKVNNSWVEQSDLTSLFNTYTNYKKGN